MKSKEEALFDFFKEHKDKIEESLIRYSEFKSVSVCLVGNFNEQSRLYSMPNNIEEIMYSLYVFMYHHSAKTLYGCSLIDIRELDHEVHVIAMLSDFYTGAMEGIKEHFGVYFHD